MKRTAFIIFIVVVTVSMSRTSVVRAAMFNIVASPHVAVGQSFRVDVALDTQGDDANAIQGEVDFPTNMFAFKGVNDGSSPVSLWIEAPHEVSPGKIVFSGIVPGGFKGSASSVVGIILTPITKGIGAITMQNVELLRNDGQGSSISLSAAGQTIIVGPAGTVPPEVSSSSSILPGTFTPVVTSDPDIYGGKYFLVFSATDKGSGINHYEVLEIPAGSSMGQNPQWITATSPYLLRDQSLSSDIYVRAVNNNGGVTVVKISPRNSWNTAGHIMLFGSTLLLIFVLLFAGFVAYRRRRRRTAKV